MTISRRTALTGIAALPVLAAAPAVAEGNPDAEVIAKAERFVEIYEESDRIRRDYMAFRKVVEADPSCQPRTTPGDDPEGYARWYAFLEERGVWAEADRWHASCRAAHRAVQDLFRTPARTPAGALVKLRVVQMAAGEFLQEDRGGDEDLICYQFAEWSEEDENGHSEKIGEEIDFLAAVIGDLERMTGRAGA